MKHTFFSPLSHLALCCMLLFAAACGDKNELTRCTSDDCQGCTKPLLEFTDLYCFCIPDSSVTCPAASVHSYYNYDVCQCYCETGWKGTNCDEVDTTYFIRFSHGADTNALSSLSTNLATVNSSNARMKGAFPVGSPLDSVLFSFIFQEGTYELCGWDCFSYMEAHFANGDSAYSLSGTVIIDHMDEHYDQYGTRFGTVTGTFSANLYIISSGQTYYIRNGEYKAYQSRYGL